MTVYMLQSLKNAMKNYFSEKGHTHSTSDLEGISSIIIENIPEASENQKGIVKLGTGENDAAKGNHTHNASDIIGLTQSGGTESGGTQSNITQFNTAWQKGTNYSGNQLNSLPATTGDIWGMIRNGFATIKFNVSWGEISRLELGTYMLGNLPEVFAPDGGVIEFAVKIYSSNHGEKQGTCQIYLEDGVLKIKTFCPGLQDYTSCVGAFTYPIANY